MPNLKILVDKDNRNHVIDADLVSSTQYEYPVGGKIIVHLFMYVPSISALTTIEFASQDAANLELSKLIDA